MVGFLLLLVTGCTSPTGSLFSEPVATGRPDWMTASETVGKAALSAGFDPASDRGLALAHPDYSAGYAPPGFHDEVAATVYLGHPELFSRLAGDPAVEMAVLANPNFERGLHAAGAARIEAAATAIGTLIVGAGTLRGQGSP